MVVDGLRQVEQVLQQPVHRGGVEEVKAAHNMGHALQRIIDDDGEMVAGGGIRA